MGDFDNLMYALFTKKTKRERELEAQEQIASEARRANDLKEREVIALEQLAKPKSES